MTDTHPATILGVALNCHVLRHGDRLELVGEVRLEDGVYTVQFKQTGQWLPLEPFFPAPPFEDTAVKAHLPTLRPGDAVLSNGGRDEFRVTSILNEAAEITAFDGGDAAYALVVPVYPNGSYGTPTVKRLRDLTLDKSAMKKAAEQQDDA